MLKVEFLGRVFFVGWRVVGVDKMSVGVWYEGGEGQLAEKLLGEVGFVFGR